MSSVELSGSVSDKEKGFIETWENVAQGINYIIRENRRGDEVYEPVAGSRKFKLSTYDRMLTEDKIADQRHNPFTNGSFRPVIVPADITIETNPNAMSDDDIRRLFAASDAAWEAYMDVIDSPATLLRMATLAEDSEITLKRLRRIEALTSELQHANDPNWRVAQKDQAQYDGMGPVGGSQNEPVAPARRGRPPKAVSA
jgi:hypothetical protein